MTPISHQFLRAGIELSATDLTMVKSCIDSGLIHFLLCPETNPKNPWTHEIHGVGLTRGMMSKCCTNDHQFVFSVSLIH